MLLALLGAVILTSPFQESLTYPVAKTVDQVDDYSGVKVSDPYRWLEQPISNPEVKAWVTEENKVTFGYLDKIDGRDRLMKELMRRQEFERFGTPEKVGENYFFTHNTGKQNQSVVFVSKGLNGKARVLIDPNTLRKDGTVAITSSDVSLDGKKYLYALSKSGSDWTD